MASPSRGGREVGSTGTGSEPGGAERGPIDASRTPRFAGPPTFALLPRRDEVGRCDVAVVGVPFDSGTSYRPGARFGPAAVRQGSRLLRPWHPGLRVAPFGAQQVADAGDIACNPFDIKEAVGQIEEGAAGLLAGAAHVLAIGGDHTIAYPLLRATNQRFGPVALVHFDAHLDTGRPTSARRSPTARPSGARPRRGCSWTSTASTLGSAVRSTPQATWRRTRNWASARSARWRSDASASTASSPRSVSACGTIRCTSRSISTCSTRLTRRAPGRPRRAA